MALGTTGVLAGVVGVFDVAAVMIAFLQMSPHVLGAAGSNGGKRAFVVVGHPVTELALDTPDRVF